MIANTSKKVTSSLFWRLAERFGAQIVTFIVSLILARLLDPQAYGAIALLTIFIAILQVFVDSGLGTALIQKKDADQLDFSTVFFANIAYCALLYGALFVLAPAIAAFYNNPELTPLVRVMGVTILISGVKNIEQAYVSKKLLFRKFFWATLFGTILSAAVGIAMAFKGYGPWALVMQSLTNTLVDTVVLWATVKWRPSLEFSFKRLKTLYKFGWKLLASSLIDVGYNELRQLIIGKRYSSSQLAFYNRGNQIPNLVINNVNASIDSVLLPTMSEEQNRKDRVKAMTRRALKTSVFIMAPILIGLAAIGNNLVLLLLGQKWLPSVFFMQVFCITYIFYPVHTANLNAIKAMGRSDYFLVLEIIKKMVGISAVLITMWISVEAMALSLLVTTFIFQVINSWPNRKLLGYSYLDQLRDILPSLGIAAVMGALVYVLEFIPSPSFVLTMLIQIAVGATFYIGVCSLLKLESYEYVKQMALSFIKGKRNKKNRGVMFMDNVANNNHLSTYINEPGLSEPRPVNASAEDSLSLNEAVRSQTNHESSTGGAKTHQRDSGLELFRIIVMILIVAHHYVVNSGLISLAYSNPLSMPSIFLFLFGAWGKIGINCFVLITGYFMCTSKITLRKFLKLLLEIMLFKIVIGSVFFVTGYQSFSLSALVEMLLPIAGVQTNFTGCFLLFFLLIPFLNILINNMNKKQHVLLAVPLFFIYSFLGNVPGIGVTFNYVTWFAVIYVFGSFLRKYPFKFDQSKKVWGLLSTLGVALCVASVIASVYVGTKTDRQMAYYFVADSNKILAVLTSICLFMFFKNIHFQSKLINLIGASTFGVLLIHANSDAMRNWLWGDVLKNTSMYGSPYLYLHAIGAVLGVFVCCSIIDIARIYLLEKPTFKFLDAKFFPWADKVKVKLEGMLFPNKE